MIQNKKKPAGKVKPTRKPAVRAKPIPSVKNSGPKIGGRIGTKR